jgi:hypothetical protein
LSPFTAFGFKLGYGVVFPVPLFKALTVNPDLSIHENADVPDPETALGYDASYQAPIFVRSPIVGKGIGIFPKSCVIRPYCPEVTGLGIFETMLYLSVTGIWVFVSLEFMAASVFNRINFVISDGKRRDFDPIVKVTQRIVPLSTSLRYFYRFKLYSFLMNPERSVLEFR